MLARIHTVAPHGFTWLTAVDILLVAYLIYQFLKLVKGTRASQMLLGTFVVTLAIMLAREGHLPMINWAIGHLLPYAAFILIVVFQAEIRHILSRIGRKLTLRSLLENGSEPYDDVVMAASLFSQRQIGALIVIEREIGLRAHIESGVPMDARLSYDLLVTIFRPNAPLHDGAVIIRKDRIAAAACFLPLSMNPVLSNQMGTRHRAAIGVTEETDAVAIIVSEETGQISLALAGRIDRDIPLEELRERLSKLLGRYVPRTIMPTLIGDALDAESALTRTPEVKR